MTPTNFSIFYYGWTVDATNNLIDFDEGGSELTAEINIGSYDSAGFIAAVKTAMDIAGALVYTVGFDRNNRKITISSTSNFTLRVTTGSHIGTSAYPLIGYISNKTGGSSYLADIASGSYYEPQFKLQSFIGSTDWRNSISQVVNKSASGKVEVVRFGIEKFTQLDIKYANNRLQDGSVIKTNTSGVTDLETFMQYLITKAPVELMPDMSDLATYETMILESTPDSQDGTGYKLREMYDRGLLGYFETGPLKFRIIE